MPRLLPFGARRSETRSCSTGEGNFIAKARILGLLRSHQLAAAVWGVDEDQKAWEHVMALGDIVEFDVPVPAASLLLELVKNKTLRSLTLVSRAIAKSW